MYISLAKKNKYKGNCLRERHRHLNESLHKLGSNCFITDSPYDIKNLIMNKPKLYRILYDANIDMYMIGDGNDVIHWDMLKESHRQGYYANYEDYIDSLGSLYNYFDVGMYGDYNDDKDVDPFLWFIVFSPDEQSWVLGDDSFDAEYHSEYGNIFTRDCDLKDIELYNVLKVSNDVKSLYNKELKEKMSTSIKAGDRVKMDFHMKSNNGATGTCKGRIGELCFIEWDDGSKSKEITSFLTKIEDIKESNELVQRAKKHKKKSKGMGWHMAVNAGDVEKGIEVFNNATSCNSGECSPMGEALEYKTFYYEGPVYLFDSIYKDVVKMYTDAPSREKALSNIRYRVCKELGRKGLKVKDEFLDEMPDNKETPTCDECGHPLNDMGQCPACEQGEEERYDDLTNLEALSKLRRMD